MHSLATVCRILLQHSQVMEEVSACPTFSRVIYSSIKMVEELAMLQFILVAVVSFMQVMKEMASRFPAITIDSQLAQEELLVKK